ncbi:MAG: hypothetical protein NT027_15325 [Proteobacteria bacterium]|nr:hypothetical protein [Pseudomonadota bacterium]
MKKPLASLVVLLALSIGGCKFRNETGSSSDLSALTQNDLRQKYGIRVVPEVVAVPKLGAFPDSLFGLYDTRTIAESIVYRLHLLYDDILPGRPVIDVQWMSESFLAMRIRSQVILNKNFYRKLDQKVMESGRESRIQIDNFFTFLNQHQTNTSSGILDIERRLKTESFLGDIKIPVNETAKKLFPKYSWLSLNSRISIGPKNNDASQYGNVIVIFRDEVKFRATLTVGDSLDHLNSYPDPSQRRNIQSTFFTTNASFRDQDDGYLESQIWGELDLRDVKRFLVGADLSTADIDLLKKLGLPIRRYELAFASERWTINESEELFNGDPVVMGQLDLLRKNSRVFAGLPAP